MIFDVIFHHYIKFQVNFGQNSCINMVEEKIHQINELSQTFISRELVENNLNIK